MKLRCEIAEDLRKIIYQSVCVALCTVQSVQLIYVLRSAHKDMGGGRSDLRGVVTVCCLIRPELAFSKRLNAI